MREKKKSYDHNTIKKNKESINTETDNQNPIRIKVNADIMYISLSLSNHINLLFTESSEYMKELWKKYKILFDNTILILYYNDSISIAKAIIKDEKKKELIDDSVIKNAKIEIDTYNQNIKKFKVYKQTALKVMKNIRNEINKNLKGLKQNLTLFKKSEENWEKERVKIVDKVVSLITDFKKKGERLNWHIDRLTKYKKFINTMQSKEDEKVIDKEKETMNGGGSDAKLNYTKYKLMYSIIKILS